MHILMVTTSHDQLGDSGHKTGLWLEELAAPYYVFIDDGCRVTMASPKGGQPPLDPKSDAPDSQSEDTERFKADAKAQASFAETLKLSTVQAAGFDALFYPGGHGPLWDLVDDPDSLRLIRDFLAAGKPVAAVCHGPCVLVNAVDAEGRSVLEGKEVTAFTNAEEEAVGLTAVVPFLLEDALKAKGGDFLCGGDWEDFVVTDGLLITGQNPQSSASTARAVLAKLSRLTNWPGQGAG
ncbi:type 1 glutamine amidotransferase domain-containing protein [Gallaecimonas kandeliae]|uniref:type 1 glutamine amidotransferase domain-containing protein n=1 Tax=Gallaecimonas kandeliae TaxID=3029055 RepID=UPI00264854E3|nr:type 1 glutamine amidotransferase domain-containing protein [Gallaecimonas kandeliae]WKE64378.1 type 1 glutamine amidotransferase domain-containing protein [Gallaecimonas kandeliae]